MKKTLFLLLQCFYIVSNAQINLTQGLVSHHPFNGNANDIGPNAINGNVVNATLTTDRNGSANSAYYFDGSSYIDLPFHNSYNFAPQGSFSISVWVLPVQNITWPAQAIVVKAPPHADFTLSTWNYGVYLFNYKAMSGYAYNHILNSTTTFVQNLCWYNIISTYNNGIWNLYVNGQLESSNTTQSNLILQDGFSRIFFGKKGESFGDWFNGKMDDVRIYNRVLTLDEIDSLSFNGSGTRVSDDIAICQGNSVQLNASGAASYSWSPAAGLSGTNIANPVANPTSTTRYYVTGTQASGCTSTDNVLVTVNPKPVVSISNDTLVCENSSVQLLASGGTTYSWSPASGLNNSGIPNPVATATNTTKYVVNVTSAQGCSNKDSVLLTVRKPGQFTISPSAGVCINNKTLQLSAGGGDTYVWTPANTLDNPGIANPTATPLQTTIYSVTIKDTVCVLTNTLSTTLTVNPLPVISVSKTNDIDCSSSNSQLLATGGVQYVWDSDPTLDNITIRNPLASPSVATLYKVTGTDINGCSNRDSIQVEVTTNNKSSYLMPSAFSPNKDGLNDCFGIKYWGAILDLEFNIYNRWGQLIFKTKNPGDCWDGTVDGAPQDAAVFVYVIKAKTQCGDIFRKGTVTLIR
jgi:gliding motility-associated-like protein